MIRNNKENLHPNMSSSDSNYETFKTPVMKSKPEAKLSPITSAIRESDGAHLNPSFWVKHISQELEKYMHSTEDNSDIIMILFQRAVDTIDHKEYGTHEDLGVIYSYYAGFQIRFGYFEDAKRTLKFMKVNHIGAKNANFYINWAHIEMVSFNYEKARAKIQEGVEKNANPLNSLQSFMKIIDQEEEKYNQQQYQNHTQIQHTSPSSDQTTPSPSPINHKSSVNSTPTTPNYAPSPTVIAQNHHQQHHQTRVTGSTTLPSGTTSVPDLLQQQQSMKPRLSASSILTNSSTKSSNISNMSTNTNNTTSSTSTIKSRFKPLGSGNIKHSFLPVTAATSTEQNISDDNQNGINNYSGDNTPTEVMSDISTPTTSTVIEPLSDLQLSDDSDQMEAEYPNQQSPGSTSPPISHHHQQQQQPQQSSFKPQQVRHPILSNSEIQEKLKQQIKRPKQPTVVKNETPVEQNQPQPQQHQPQQQQQHRQQHYNDDNEGHIDKNRTYEIAKSWSDTTTVNGKSYLKIEFIGKGGSGKVFKVLSQDLKIYALKYVCLKTGDSDIESQLNEIEMLRKLSKYDNIIKLIDSEVNLKQGTILLVLELGDIDLAKLLFRQQQLSNGKGINENLLRIYWQQMLCAVHTIHEERIIHGDLKPANFVSVQGHLKLIDFGIAKAIQNDTTNIVRDAQVGTLNYISPEALIDTGGNDNAPKMKLGRASDIWSLGCILYEMAYGYSPFKHITNLLTKYQAIVNPKHQITYPQHRNAALLDVLRRCLQRDPLARPTIPALLDHPFLNS